MLRLHVVVWLWVVACVVAWPTAHAAGHATPRDETCPLDGPGACVSDGDVSAWRPPSATGRHWLERFKATGCDSFASLNAKDAAKGMSPSEPALVRKALRKSQRAKYDMAALLETHGATRVAHAHPAYYVLAQGNPEKTQHLAAFVRDMRYSEPANASVAFDHAAQIGAREKVLGLPFELEDDMPIKIFSLGADGAGFGMHSHGPTYSRLAHGYKLWLVSRPGTLLPPEITEPVWGHGFELVERYERLRQLHSKDAGENATTMIEALTVCLQPPGTAVYLPDGWLHATINLGDTVGLALQSRYAANAGRMTFEGGQQKKHKALIAQAERMMAHPTDHTIDDLTVATGRMMANDEVELAVAVSNPQQSHGTRNFRCFFTVGLVGPRYQIASEQTALLCPFVAGKGDRNRVPKGSTGVLHDRPGRDNAE